MKKIFISHSTKDKELVEKLIGLLRLGMGVSRKQIFCTSMNGSLQTGSNYIQGIKTEIEDDWAIMAIISENYLKSVSCTMELGAAWILKEKAGFFPILISPVSYEKMDGTLMKGTQMLRIDNQDNMLNLYDDFCKLGLIEQQSTAEFLAYLQKFISEVENLQTGENMILEKSRDGYYEAEITEVRNVPEVYRCYRIKGRIMQKDVYEENETHWLFYQTNLFPDLAVGDRVKFKVSKTELRQFGNLKNARNIYPAVLYKVEER